MAPVTPNIDIFCFVVTMIFTVYTLVVFVSKEGICYICISLRPPYAKAERRCRHKLQRVSGGRRGASVHDGIIIPIDLLIPRVTTAVKQRILHFPHERLFYCYCLVLKKKESGTTICFSFFSYFLLNRLPLRPDFFLGVTGTELPKVVVVPKVVVGAPNVAGAAVVPKVGAVPKAGAAPNTAVPKAAGAADVGGAPKVEEEEKENTGGLVVVVAPAVPRAVVVVLPLVVGAVPATCTYMPRI